MEIFISNFLVVFSQNFGFVPKIPICIQKNPINSFPRVMPSHQLQLPPRNKILDCIIGLSHQPVMHEYISSGCPRKNVPLKAGFPSHKGTLFLGHPLYI